MRALLLPLLAILGVKAQWSVTHNFRWEILGAPVLPNQLLFNRALKRFAIYFTVHLSLSLQELCVLQLWWVSSDASDAIHAPNAANAVYAFRSLPSDASNDAHHPSACGKWRKWNGRIRHFGQCTLLYYTVRWVIIDPNLIWPFTCTLLIHNSCWKSILDYLFSFLQLPGGGKYAAAGSYSNSNGNGPFRTVTYSTGTQTPGGKKTKN